MSNNNPFNTHKPDLGDLQTGIDRATVDHLFRTSDISTPCIICKGYPNYKIIPKYEHLKTIEIEDKGFICQPCVTGNKLDPSQYGLRPL